MFIWFFIKSDLHVWIFAKKKNKNKKKQPEKQINVLIELTKYLNT